VWVTENIIVAQGLGKRFGKIEALAGLNLTSRSGQVTAVPEHRHRREI
jgi:ABC-type sugar transport system ATPase subunit